MAKKKPARIRLLQIRPRPCPGSCVRENELSFWQARFAPLRLRDVEAVPDRGAVVVVIDARRGEQFKADLAEVRGKDFARATGTSVVSIGSWGRQDQLLGEKRHVVLAHCFRMYAPVHLLRAVAELARDAGLADRSRRARGRKA